MMRHGTCHSNNLAKQLISYARCHHGSESLASHCRVAIFARCVLQPSKLAIVAFPEIAAMKCNENSMCHSPSIYTICSVTINGCLPYANNQGLEQSFPCRTSLRMANGKGRLAISGQSQEKAALL